MISHTQYVAFNFKIRMSLKKGKENGATLMYILIDMYFYLQICNKCMYMNLYFILIFQVHCPFLWLHFFAFIFPFLYSLFNIYLFLLFECIECESSIAFIFISIYIHFKSFLLFFIWYFYD